MVEMELFLVKKKRVCDSGKNVFRSLSIFLGYNEFRNSAVR